MRYRGRLAIEIETHQAVLIVVAKDLLCDLEVVGHCDLCWFCD